MEQNGLNSNRVEVGKSEQRREQGEGKLTLNAFRKTHENVLLQKLSKIYSCTCLTSISEVTL